MLEQNVMIGMKVVAHKKTVPKYKRYDNFMGGYDFLYVTTLDNYETGVNKGKKVFTLHENLQKKGNYFFAEDFEPIELTQPKAIKSVRRRAEFDVGYITTAHTMADVINETTTLGRFGF